MLNFAVKMEYLEKNPLIKVGNFKDAYMSDIVQKEKVQYYTAEEFSAYIGTVRMCAEKGDNLLEWGMYVFFNIAFFTGMRKGEMNALKWTDLEGDTIHVRRSVAQKIKGDDIETPPKNRTSYRSIKIPKALADVIAEHRERCEKLEEFTEEFRICGCYGFLRDNTIRKKNIYYAEQSNLHVIRIHDFRHSHATLLANNRINIQEIARRLGHAKIEITWNTYSHLYPEEESLAIAVLEQVIKHE